MTLIDHDSDDSPDTRSMAGERGPSVPWLSRAVVEAEAEGLLQAFQARGEPIDAPPVPVEEILEQHLGLALELDSLAERLGVVGEIDEEDLSGATWLAERVVVISSRLDPSENPNLRGRFNFSVAHEIGHWVLHAPLVGGLAAGIGASDTSSRDPLVLCRASGRRPSVEWQTDRFASDLLMPRRLVRTVWKAVTGRSGPFHVSEVGERESRLRAIEWFRHGALTEEHFLSDEHLLDALARPIADAFGASAMAMRIRLEEMGLLVRDVSERPTTAARS